MNPSTLLDLIDEGFSKNTTDIAAATKRNGIWLKTEISGFRENVRYFALGLYELGVRPGDKVALHSESCTEWLWIDQAILSIGAASVPIYTTQPGDQIKFILENSGAKAYVYSKDDLFDSVKSMIKQIKTVHAVISFLPSVHAKVKTTDQVISRGKELAEKDHGLFDRLRAEVKYDQLATLIYTSGTTGRPKGVMLSHHNLVSNIRSTVLHMPFDVEVMRGHRMLSYLPLSHVLERMGTFMYIYMGYPIYFIEDIMHFADELKEVDPVFFITVPRLMEKIHLAVRERGEHLSGWQQKLFFWAISLAENYNVDDPPTGLEAFKYTIADKIVYSKIREVFGKNLVGIISGGAALSPLIVRFFSALGYFCNQGYGLTESSPVLTLNDLAHHKTGSAGY
ncbi:MAG TPA: AMP-binding protein, partial [Balneolales bacterium]|nr:AMP-binding protein [Balneolales bacterium]